MYPFPLIPILTPPQAFPDLFHSSATLHMLSPFPFSRKCFLVPGLPIDLITHINDLRRFYSSVSPKCDLLDFPFFFFLVSSFSTSLGPRLNLSYVSHPFAANSQVIRFERVAPSFSRQSVFLFPTLFFFFLWRSAGQLWFRLFFMKKMLFSFFLLPGGSPFSNVRIFLEVLYPSCPPSVPNSVEERSS